MFLKQLTTVIFSILLTFLLYSTGLLFPVLVLTQEPVTRVVQAISFMKSPPHLTPEQIVTVTKQSYNLAIKGYQPAPAPLLTPAEQSHLHDVYVLFHKLRIIAIALLILTGVICVLFRRYLYMYVGVFIQVVKLLSFTVFTAIISGIFFNILFTYIHVVFFPQGNWSFPATSLMLQVYPQTFWLLCFALWDIMLLIPIAAYILLKASLQR